MRRDRFSVCCIVLIGTVVLGWSLESWSAEPVTPIGSLLVNPTAAHRKVIMLEGVAKEVAAYSGIETGTKQALCGADFKLEDDTGTIDVVYHVRCQAGQEQATVVVEGMRVVVDGHMEAPPAMLRTGEGKDLGVMVLARMVSSSKK